MQNNVFLYHLTEGPDCLDAERGGTIRLFWPGLHTGNDVCGGAGMRGLYCYFCVLVFLGAPVEPLIVPHVGLPHHATEGF